jgi:hypothetical protein
MARGLQRKERDNMDHDHYPDHTVLDDLLQLAETNLFDEMDAIAADLRGNPLHVPDDDQIAFRQLQRVRRPDLGKDEFLDRCGPNDTSPG